MKDDDARKPDNILSNQSEANCYEVKIKVGESYHLAGTKYPLKKSSRKVGRKKKFCVYNYQERMLKSEKGSKALSVNLSILSYFF